MGVVWRAVDPELGRSVALKTVQLAFAVTREEAETFEKRFLSEARAAAKLSHPGIVVVHDVGRDTASETLYIAFEHLKGRTLGELVAGGQPLEWRQAVRIVSRVAEASNTLTRRASCTATSSRRTSCCSTRESRRSWTLASPRSRQSA